MYKNRISKLLLQIGITPDKRGFDSLIEIINRKIISPKTAISKIENELADEQGIKAVNIHKWIMYITQKIELNTIHEVFGCKIERLTPAVFVALASYYIKSENKEVPTK